MRPSARGVLSLAALRCMAVRPSGIGVGAGGLLPLLVNCAAWVIGPAGEARADSCNHGVTGRVRL